MTNSDLHKIITYCIAIIWIVNGFFCKVLNLVPRHGEIVQNILNLDNSSAYFLTFLIGLSEIVMAIWVLSRFKPRLNAITQIVVVATMNALEFIFVPDLLFWGKWNALFAFLFILVVYYNEFRLNKTTK